MNNWSKNGTFFSAFREQTNCSSIFGFVRKRLANICGTKLNLFARINWICLRNATHCFELVFRLMKINFEDYFSIRMYSEAYNFFSKFITLKTICKFLNKFNFESYGAYPSYNIIIFLSLDKCNAENVQADFAIGTLFMFLFYIMASIE